MVVGFSEPAGFFRSDNLISNEMAFQHVIPELQKTQRRGAYIGVGPDQNFTYITALRPKMAFIVDIRRQNMLLHLHVQGAASRCRPTARISCRGCSRGRGRRASAADATAQALFDAFETVSADDGLQQTNLRAIFDHLERTHGFPLTEADENSIKFVYTSFYLGGPGPPLFVSAQRFRRPAVVPRPTRS